MIFTGREIRQEDNGTIRVNQTKCIGSTKLGIIDTKTLPEAELVGPMKTEFRHCVGSLQYVAGSTRPDICAPTSLAQKSAVTPMELQQAYDAMKFLHDTADVSIALPPINLNRALVVTYGDSSVANADGCKTQVGALVVVTERRSLFQMCPGCLVDWRSCRTQRVVRSTVAAEAIACDTGCDHGIYVAHMLDDMLTGRSPVKGHRSRPDDARPRPTIEVRSLTDCRSLFGASQKVAPSIDEKRTLIDVLGIKERVCMDGVKWRPTDKQLVDDHLSLKLIMARPSSSLFTRDHRA